MLGQCRDKSQALPGADYVVVAVARKRYPLWEQDFRVPFAYGLQHTYGENGGPGAAFHALRNFQIVIPICRDVEEICPNAWVLNFTNPEARTWFQGYLRELVNMVKRAMERSSLGRALGTTQRIIADMINFSSDPSFAVDRDGKVVAWNDSMEQLTDVPANAMMGKGDNIYSEPFFGTRKKMLVNLVFESDDEIKRQKYMLVSRVPKGPVIAVIRGQKKDGGEWTL